MAWRKEMGNKGWTQAWWNYQYVTAEKFVDPSIFAWGKDNNYFDGGNASLLCTHGGFNNDGWYGVMHTKVNGKCTVGASEMKLGKASGGKLRFAHLSSCNSVRWDLKEKWWEKAAKGKIHVITGFHGYMYIGSKYVKEYKELAKKGFTKGVGKVWVDEMHHTSHWYNSWNTVCPIALGFGDTKQHSLDALDEKYNSNWSDKAPNWMSYRWISKCDPDGGPKLP
ncbi:MAG: hypothetical protein HC877_01460 [Thioploca sp.]|nr:hypothetical protein [Thioploca sp.]